MRPRWQSTSPHAAGSNAPVQTDRPKFCQWCSCPCSNRAGISRFFEDDGVIRRRALRFCKRLVEVPQDVLNVLESNRDADQVLGHAGGFQLKRTELLVGGGT